MIIKILDNNDNCNNCNNYTYFYCLRIIYVLIVYNGSYSEFRISSEDDAAAASSLSLSLLSARGAKPPAPPKN